MYVCISLFTGLVLWLFFVRFFFFRDIPLQFEREESNSLQLRTYVIG